MSRRPHTGTLPELPPIEPNPLIHMGSNVPPAETEPAAVRTPMDIATDAVSSTLWGALCGLEVEMSGDLRAVGMALDKTIEKYLASIKDSEGPAVAEQFAKRLRKTCNTFVREMAAA